MKISTTANSRFALLREKCKIDVYLSQDVVYWQKIRSSEARNRRKAAKRYQ